MPFHCAVHYGYSIQWKINGDFVNQTGHPVSKGSHDDVDFSVLHYKVSGDSESQFTVQCEAQSTADRSKIIPSEVAIISVVSQ